MKYVESALGEVDMTEKQIIEETLHYLTDESYNYAVLIDGEWGCGKTYFVKNMLIQHVEQEEKQTNRSRKVIYLSLYGCKTVQDIQEIISWQLVDELSDKLQKEKRWIKRIKAFVKRKKSLSQAGTRFMLTSRIIVSGVLKKYIPEINIFEIAEGWIQMKSYIFIFDDIERCDCSLNEAFGFINGLVEHERAKVILVANEKEISVKQQNLQKEMQYLVASNDKITWGKKNAATREQISVSDLEDRRKQLFSDAESDEGYRKVREKLVGVTLHYQPDINLITENIIQSIRIEDELKAELMAQRGFFISFMQSNKHCNLRTFQFFISKICYLFGKLKALELEPEYKSETLRFLVKDCFSWAVRFKGNVAIPSDGWQRAVYEAERKSEVIKEYVEAGEYDERTFHTEVEKYIQEEIIAKLNNDDPLNLLCDQYFFHSQQWCEQKLTEVRGRLEHNKYPVYIYAKIVRLLVDFAKIGFSEEYLATFKMLMVKNIETERITTKIDDGLFIMEEGERKQKTRAIIQELNTYIVKNENQLKQTTVAQLFLSTDWLDRLMEYVQSDIYTNSIDCAIFSKITPESWMQGIKQASVEVIDRFRRWLHISYSQYVINGRAQEDLTVISEIANCIETDEEKDLIKKLNLSWLQEEMLRIVAFAERN